MIKTILFGTEFTLISQRAEDYVFQIASAAKARVVLLHAVEPISGVDIEKDAHFKKFIENLETKAQENAKPIVQRFQEGGLECELRVEMGVRWRTVVEVADDIDADLVVLGSHRIHEGDKVYVGTTSHKVFFATDRPLMIVPQGE